MSFPFNIYLGAFLSSFIAALILAPLWRKWSYKHGLVDDPGHRKIHDKPVALAGGLAVITAMIVPVIVGTIALLVAWPSGEASAITSSTLPQPPGFDAKTIALLSYGLNRRAVQLATIFLGGLAMVILGWMDDKHELSPAVKFGGQLLIATLVAAAGIRITLFVENLFFSYAITVLWILTLINAFNFMDNMNGLCAGLGAISSWYFASVAAVHGQYLVALIALLTCGALLGFLPYNFPKASVFLGDAGSHLIGYLMAVLAILPHFYSRENPKVWAVLSPLLILAVPLVDLIWVVILRWRMGRPFYVGDTNHLSHRLVRLGWSRTGAVLLIWLLAAALGALSFVAA
ncbi:MAG: undecaprenyl/decaprenyl-phosphate alpha-N-acetylglucosaminyl 1-phosphate transferase [Verrucomicrobia bacterium]|nr:undecaprenyl/decaprenyl-phosphate alpha-N-acetylglucosaminyl 1-phosphate transferase [Verrucomicrobiota bacterium]